MAGGHSKLSWPQDDPTVRREIIVNSTATPPELLAYLRQVLRLSETSDTPLRVNPNLAPSVHPSELPWCFVVPGHQWGSPAAGKTPLGSWKEKARTHVAIRGPLSSRLRYEGVIRTLEYEESVDEAGKKKKKKRTATAAGWTIVQYHCLREEGRDMVIEDKMTLCIVSNKKNKAQLVHNQATPHESQVNSSSEQFQEPSSSFSEGSSQLCTEEEFEDLGKMLTSFLSQEHPIYLDLELPDVVPRPMGGGAQPTGSPVWMYMSKIYKKAPQQVLYAVCNECHRMLIGDSTGGTSHPIRHPCTKRMLEEACGPRT